MIVHHTYPQPAPPAPYAETPKETRTPGACLGPEIRRFYDLVEGDVVTYCDTQGAYFFDPLFKINGNHYVRVPATGYSVGAALTWLQVEVVN